MPRQPSFTVMRRPSASVKAAMSSALPKACSEICARRIAVHAAAGIGGDLPDLDDARAEPALRRRLHGIGEPAVERRDDRTGERRGRLDRDRPDGVRPDRPAPDRAAAGGCGAGLASNRARVTRRARIALTLWIGRQARIGRASRRLIGLRSAGRSISSCCGQRPGAVSEIGPLGGAP